MTTKPTWIRTLLSFFIKDQCCRTGEDGEIPVNTIPYAVVVTVAEEWVATVLVVMVTH